MQNIIIVSFAILACVCLVQGNSSSTVMLLPTSSPTPEPTTNSTLASSTAASTAAAPTTTPEPATTSDAAISVKAFGGLVVSLFVIALL